MTRPRQASGTDCCSRALVALTAISAEAPSAHQQQHRKRQDARPGEGDQHQADGQRREREQADLAAVARLQRKIGGRAQRADAGRAHENAEGGGLAVEEVRHDRGHERHVRRGEQADGDHGRQQIADGRETTGGRKDWRASLPAATPVAAGADARGRRMASSAPMMAAVAQRVEDEAPGFRHVDEQHAGDGRADHAAEVEHHGADAERAGNDGAGPRRCP